MYMSWLVFSMEYDDDLDPWKAPMFDTNPQSEGNRFIGNEQL